MATPAVIHLRDTRADQPAAAVGNAGVLFCVTDEGNIVERSNGTTWEAYSPDAPTGDVSSSAALTDHALVRGDGGANGVQTSGVLVSDDDEISGYKGNIKRVTASSYTLLAADSGKLIELDDGTGVALDMPNDLPQGWNATIVQWGAGAITFTPASGASMIHRQSHTKSAGEGAVCLLYISSNSDSSSAEYVLGGDTAA